MFEKLVKHGLNYRFKGGMAGCVTALHLHRVVSAVDPLSNEISSERFDWLLGMLSRYFNVLSLDEALALLGSSDLLPRSIVITFDDGYADNYLNALPLLQKWQMPATFFVATGYLDGGIMFNDIIIEAVRGAQGAEIDLSSLEIARIESAFSRPVRIDTVEQKREAIGALLKAIKYLPSDDRVAVAGEVADVCGSRLPDSLMMTTGQVAGLHEAGMQIGGHSHSHPVLTRVGLDRVKEDLAQNKKILEALISKPVDVFAYPNGIPEKDFTHEHIEILKELNYRAALTTMHGVITSRSDLFRLPRFMPWRRTWSRFMCQMWDNAGSRDCCSASGATT